MSGLDKNIPVSNYSLIPNELVLDSRISSGAIKIYLYLASRPIGWIVKNCDVKDKTGVKSDSVVSKYWQELLESGWLTRKKGTPSSSNKCGYYDYVLMSSPNHQDQANYEESSNFNIVQISTSSKFEESSNLEKDGVSHPSITVNTAPAPAIDNYNINNNNTCLSLSEKEEINKNENNTENISFGYFSLTKSCHPENENRQDTKTPNEKEEEEFLMECKAVFKNKHDSKNAASEKSVSGTNGFSNSLPSGSSQNAPNSNDGNGSVSFIAKNGNMAEKGACGTSDSSDDAAIHVFGKDHNGNDLLFKLDNDSPSVDAKKKSPNKMVKPDKMFFDYDNNVIQNINENDLKKWKEAFPAVDIDLDIKRAEVWLKANPAKRKKNIDAFLTRWFSKSQEKGGSYPSNSNGRYFGNNKDELKSEWADRVLGKVIGKGMKASPEAIAEMKAYEESGDAPF
jgi:hypothetical protein